MFWAALAYAGGIVAGSYVLRPASWVWVAVATIAAGFYCGRRQKWLGVGLTLSSFVAVGGLQVQLRNSNTKMDIAPRLLRHGEAVEITAHVTREGRFRQSNYGELSQSLDVETEDIVSETGAPVPVRSGVRLTIYDSHQAHPAPGGTPAPMRHFRYGERIRLPVKLKQPRNFRNPGAFDYAGYLNAMGIANLGSAKSENVEALAGFCGSRVERWRSRLHSSIIAKVQALWPAPQAALLDAMVIGEEAFLDRDTRVDFQRSGTYHVLVVSGMNVTILACVIFWTVRRLRASESFATWLTILFCVAYAFLTDVGAPVWRATLMCAVYLGARLLYRDRSALNSLGTAALALLVFDPNQLFTASFQMTFLCVLIIAAIGVPLLERSSQLYRQALAHWDAEDFGPWRVARVAQFRLDLRMIADRLAPFLGRTLSLSAIRIFVLLGLGSFELLLVSAIMQSGLALPMAFYFHRATTMGLPANLAVVPLTELLMPAAVATLGLGYVSMFLAKPLVMVTAVALHLITGTVRGLGGLRLADLRVATPSPAMILAAATALTLAMIFAGKRRLLAVSGLVLLAAVVVFAVVPPKPTMRAGVLEVTTIDVGEGDSILLVAPEGRTLLIDAGGPTWGASSQLDFGEDVVAPYLWSRRIS